MPSCARIVVWLQLDAPSIQVALSRHAAKIGSSEFSAFVDKPRLVVLAVHIECGRRAVICSGALGVANEGLDTGCDGALLVQKVSRVREPWTCIRRLAIRRWCPAGINEPPCLLAAL